jgi:hypothetical protein
MTETPIAEMLRQLLAKRLGGNGADLNAILANHFAQQLGAAPVSEIDGEAVEIATDETTDEPLQRASGSPDALRERLAKVRAENKRLVEINDTLAGALGACPLCWGDDPDCGECGGNGVPGSAPPRQALFAKYVLPALRRRKEERQGAATPGSVASKGRKA